MFPRGKQLPPGQKRTRFRGLLGRCRHRRRARGNRYRCGSRGRNRTRTGEEPQAQPRQQPQPHHRSYHPWKLAPGRCRLGFGGRLGWRGRRDLRLRRCRGRGGLGGRRRSSLLTSWSCKHSRLLARRHWLGLGGSCLLRRPSLGKAFRREDHRGSLLAGFLGRNAPLFFGQQSNRALLLGGPRQNRSCQRLSQLTHRGRALEGVLMQAAGKAGFQLLPVLQFFPHRLRQGHPSLFVLVNHLGAKQLNSNLRQRKYVAALGFGQIYGLSQLGGGKGCPGAGHPQKAPTQPREVNPVRRNHQDVVGGKVQMGHRGLVQTGHAGGGQFQYVRSLRRGKPGELGEAGSRDRDEEQHRRFRAPRRVL
ncbi:hypothetical protein HRbin09_01772 [bacterium HR09]|nr:hypothetical protein HRbin09_01772 [bacterium HR09]